MQTPSVHGLQQTPGQQQAAAAAVAAQLVGLPATSLDLTATPTRSSRSGGLPLDAADGMPAVRQSSGLLGMFGFRSRQKKRVRGAVN